MKFCKDCKYMKRDWMSPFSHRFAGCEHPKNMRTNLINGTQEKRWSFACVVRIAGGSDCGPNADWFEAKS